MKTAKKEKKTAKVIPEMVTYSMKMTIPTGQYANIIPEIVVKGGSIEEAHDFVAPHMNKLWKEYFMCSERVNQPAKPTPVAPGLPKDENSKVNVPGPAPVSPPVVAQVAPASEVSLNKATQAIASCMSLEALNLISAQVEKSPKLIDEHKAKLRILVTEKMKDFVDPTK